MKSILLLTTLFVGIAMAHDEYYGECPVFTPMTGFNWDKVTNNMPNIVDIVIFFVNGTFTFCLENKFFKCKWRAYNFSKIY